MILKVSFFVKTTYVTQIKPNLGDDEHGLNDNSLEKIVKSAHSWKAQGFLVESGLEYVLPTRKVLSARFLSMTLHAS